MRCALALLLLVVGCSGFENTRVYPMAEIESRYSHNAWVAGGVNVQTRKHNFDVLLGTNLGISDHRDHGKIRLDSWGGILRWRMK